MRLYLDLKAVMHANARNTGTLTHPDNDHE